MCLLFLLIKSGIITSLPNDSNEIEIQIGFLKTNVNIDKLMKTKNNTNTQTKPKKSLNNNKSNAITKSKTISPEINVIGLNVEEATQIVDKYLDDANLSKLETIRIVHGKGTGKLRVRNSLILKNTPSC